MNEIVQLHGKKGLKMKRVDLILHHNEILKRNVNDSRGDKKQ